ncbi:glycosyltransferase [Paenibacillus barengoltzii]|uniref:glycosyltransferase n=1 Tax=Paenibacillus barengoltzii TaxID=343517 RepID=UPI003F8921D5
MSKSKVIWEGPFAEMHSLAKVNRNISNLLLKSSRFEFCPCPPGRYSEHPLADKKKSEEMKGDVLVSHQWPPRMTRVDASKFWISMIPWEFGAIPASWYIPMKYEMDEIWVYSLYNKECYVNSGLPEEKIRVIPLGVDEKIYHPNKPCTASDESVFRFLYVGGTIGRKGFDLLLQAYQEEFTTQDQVCLIVKDHGNHTHYKGITMEQHIQKAQADPDCPPIQYIDREMTEHELASLYRSCHCSVFPYRGEGFGLPIIESMACGTPVIVPRLGPAGEFCRESFTFFISGKLYRHHERKVGDSETIDYPCWIEPDIRELKAMMRHVYEQRKSLQEIGLKASNHIRTNFSWRQTREAVAHALEHILARPPYSRIRPHTIVSFEECLIRKDVCEDRVEQAMGKNLALMDTFPDRLDIRVNNAQMYLKKKKYLEAIRLLVEMEDVVTRESEELQLKYWTTLAMGYGGIQSWSMSVHAFKQAAKLKTDVRELEIPLLHSAIRSLRLLIGYLYKELGDGYRELHQIAMAASMYQEALAHGMKPDSFNETFHRMKETLKNRMQTLLETIACYDALPGQDAGMDTPIWVSSGDRLPAGFDACSEVFRSFYLPGQRVLVCEDIRHLEQHNPSSSGQNDHQWEGVIFLNIDPTNERGQLIKTFQWCTRYVVREGTVMVRHAEEHDANAAWHALMVYGGWKEKGEANFHDRNKERSCAKYSVYQRHIPTVLWHSPLHNASGYATEQKHFLESLKPYPYHIRIEVLDRSDDLNDASAYDRISSQTTFPEEPFIHYQAAPAHLFVPPKAPLSVGRTMFETDRLPSDWVVRLNEMTEIWVPSRFNRETFIRSGVHEKKIRVVPGTLDESVYSRDRVTPYPLDGARGFRFLSVFDWSVRKGWDVLLQAYMETFTSLDDISLILKISRINEPLANVHAEIHHMKSKLGLSSPPHIIVMDSRMTEDEMIRLYAACDAFVLPTRGEGWGRPFMEAMAMQLPVIGTNWSGQLEFMDSENSYLIDVERLNPVPDTMPPHFHGHLWAEPSTEHLKQLMQYVVQHPEEAKAKGRLARESLFPKYSLQQTGWRLYKSFRDLIRNFV